MAQPDSRNAGRGRLLTPLSDAIRTQIASGGNPAVGTLLPNRPPLKQLSTGEEKKNPLKVGVQAAGTGTNPTQLPTKVIPQIQNQSPVMLKGSLSSAQSSLSLKPSVQVSPLVPAVLTVPTVRNGVQPESISPSPGPYSTEPVVDFPRQRFLTTAEL